MSMAAGTAPGGSRIRTARSRKAAMPRGGCTANGRFGAPTVRSWPANSGVMAGLRALGRQSANERCGLPRGAGSATGRRPSAHAAGMTVPAASVARVGRAGLIPRPAARAIPQFAVPRFAVRGRHLPFFHWQAPYRAPSIQRLFQALSGPSGSTRAAVFAWRLNLVQSGANALELRLEASRRESANDNAEAENGIGFRLTARW